jgi:hypothetical protein
MMVAPRAWPSSSLEGVLGFLPRRVDILVFLM